MSELIAKRYIKALKNDMDAKALENISEIFSGLALSFKDEKFLNVISNPAVSSQDKTNIILDAVKSAKSEKVNNFIKLLGENNRLNVIPSLSAALNKDIAQSTKTYTGVVYSDSDIDASVIKNLGDGLGKKYDSKITLDFVKSEFNGIKVDVEDLGIEINFSKSRINDQIIEHIAKAI
ncbi:F0F1 ATP synthase subunit delta [Sulfurimonas lithotrophica]|uniref:ATP synthase subunit delta n=1 Tax=Sulfurimonas lithotrophica TaxID=2590022 RepID=A0A5P8NZW9_9BACT|nr:F0F1 ATP synthase subunit delta [Sulfurimonas lithotrophica]QFR48993.1 F0F1 ATP synthase subunit delta [Sulfurimonas lithotrophica]